MNHRASRLPLAVSLTLVTAVWAPAPASAQEDNQLTILSWGGSYAEGQRQAYIEPFSEETGIDAKVADYVYGGDFSDIEEQVQSGDPKWQVVDISLSSALRGCENGYLEPIAPSMLPPAPDGTPAIDDFLPNTLHECAVGQYIWSTMWAYDKRAVEQKPETLEDVFDLEAFPGERGMQKSAKNNVEWALMADGVAPEDVYKELNTETGKARAFDKLDSIRDQIRWWEDGSKPQAWLTGGEVTMSSAYNGRIFNEIAKNDQPLGYIWDGQVWTIEVWAIPRGAPNMADALKFISYATRTESMAQLTEFLSYAPGRQSSLPLVRREYQSHMPTAPGNRRDAVQASFLWWADNGEEMGERFDAWLGEQG
jgi:putative spermidine/putrescine transport system substrate-binding protein